MSSNLTKSVFFWEKLWFSHLSVAHNEMINTVQPKRCFSYSTSKMWLSINILWFWEHKSATYFKPSAQTISIICQTTAGVASLLCAIFLSDDLEHCHLRWQIKFCLVQKSETRCWDLAGLASTSKHGRDSEITTEGVLFNQWTYNRVFNWENKSS